MFATNASVIGASVMVVVVLSRGMELRLQVMPETLRILADAGIRVHVAETSEAAKLYNELAVNHRVGGLFHATC